MLYGFNDRDIWRNCSFTENFFTRWLGGKPCILCVDFYASNRWRMLLTARNMKIMMLLPTFLKEEIMWLLRTVKWNSSYYKFHKKSKVISGFYEFWVQIPAPLFKFIWKLRFLMFAGDIKIKNNGWNNLKQVASSPLETFSWNVTVSDAMQNKRHLGDKVTSTAK